MLKEKFDLGLFENPYVDPEMASKVVGNAEFQQKADLALRKSIVLLRNEQKQLPLSPKTKVYFESYKEEAPARGQQAAQPLAKSPNKVLKLANSNSNLIFVDTKEEADVVVLWLFPTTGGLFSSGGKPIELGLSKNKIDVNYVNNMIENKPTIVAINFTNPWVIDELKLNKTKGFLATFGTSAEALADVISGKFNPSGKMPFATPSSDKAVSENKSDLPGSAENPGYALFNFGEGLSY